MSTEDALQKVAIDMAVVKERLQTMDEKLDKHCDTADSAFKDIYSRLSKYDIIFGKVGMVVTAALFILTLVLTNVAAFIRELFTKN